MSVKTRILKLENLGKKSLVECELITIPGPFGGLLLFVYGPSLIPF